MAAGLILVATAFSAPSELWGESGELWDPVGRLPDFSYAGYAAGERELPDEPVTSSVVDHGAVPDDGLDDHAAFQAALDAGGVVEVPAGTWRIEDILSIARQDVVLRGVGPESVLDLPFSLTDVRGEAAQWSWNGGLIWIAGPGLGEELTTVGDAMRGDVRLPVSTTDLLSPGQLVVLELTDDDDRTLGAHLHNDQDEPGDCDYMLPLVVRWPVRIESISDGEVTLAQPLKLDVQESWSPQLHALDALSEVGIEHLTLRFPDVEYADHLNEPGYNGIFLDAGVVDSWVRDVQFVNADSGLLVDTLTKNVTGTGLSFTGRQGHHGFNVAQSHDGLYTDLRFDQYFVHHMTVDHRASGNVFSQIGGSETPIHLDHHRDSPFENLWTAIHAEVDLVNGGNFCAGEPGGARNTFWGIESELIPPYWAHVQTTIVGPTTGEATQTADGVWIEPMDRVNPPDLHRAQLARRLGTELPDTGAPDTGEPSSEPPDGCACGVATTPTPLFLLALLLVRRQREES
ncbi:MAG: hypothetical protein GY913_17090 [Proteobacteria bacterium]|nr:hypothetical protein [Pseudomonadota bacterium]MCP4918621.1 hypothetical protein [Pseudomonadota bacterium]